MEKSEFSFVDKALLSDEKNTVQAKQWLEKCYSDSASLETMVKRWYAGFKRDYTDTNDAERSGHPNWAVVLWKPKHSSNSFWPIVSWSCMR